VSPTPFSSLREALGWLDSFIDYESAMPSRRAVPTLERMWALMALLGDPQQAYQVVHLTGTNGKGSTAEMCTALLSQMGLSVGTYTSPNLSEVNERLSLHGRPIEDGAFTELLSVVASAVDAMEERPTRFEILTAAALRWFADEAVDVAVIEVGLGGTWDCTNVVKAQVAVITNISYDHTEVLGPTLEGIASDKAGIVKTGSTAVVGERDPGLVDVIATRAFEAGAAGVLVGDRDFSLGANRLAVGGRLVDVITPSARYDEVLVPLHGAHQGTNAACALTAVEAFFGAPLPSEVVEAAFATVSIPGRLEVVGRRPLWLVDGAHNVAGMAALAQAISEEFSVEGTSVAVLGMLRGRDPLAMLQAMVPSGITSVVACAPASPRALAPEVIAEAAEALGLSCEVVPSVARAVEHAGSQVDEDGLCVVAGSLYVVADARALLCGAERAGR
jgi:dihydrofolate synthase/folylpolyglutamate synthase